MYASERTVVLALVPLLCALSAFPQSGVASVNRADPPGEATIRLTGESETFAVSNFFNISESSADPAATLGPEIREPQKIDLAAQQSQALPKPGRDPGFQPSRKLQVAKLPDFNREIYYRNKLEYSLDVGWLPINIPFPLDIFVGDNYNTYPLKYTLVPIIASLRWHISGISGPVVLRGNWDLTCSGSITAIPRGPESRYFAYIMGIRRNFVPRRSRVAPYFDVRLGFGDIDAKGPYGVPYAQGQDLTFTVNMGSGIRYNLSPRYSISAGLNFMHISNLDLSESNGKPNWGIRNYGINVYGPMIGTSMELRRRRRQGGQ